MLARRLYWTAYLLRRLRGQGAYPFRPAGAICRSQAQRVSDIVGYASRHVPYYRETFARLGLAPAAFASAADLARLPIIEREQLQRDPEYFVSDAMPRANLLLAQSSGSSGMPVRVFYDTRAVINTILYAERSRSIATRYIGKRLHYRETTILQDTGTDAKLTRWARQSTLLPRNWPGRRQFLRVTDPVDQSVAAMEEFKPDLIRTFGSYLELLYPCLVASGRSFHRPRLVTYGGDCLSESVRQLISGDLGIPILSGYQAIEATRIAFECEQHQGLHINIDLHPIRVVDGEGRDLPPGTPGDVVVSTLANRATVLLNYRLGDTAALWPGTCPCGRSLPLMSFPLGRVHDFVELPSGRLLNPVPLLAPLVRVPGMCRWQLVQETPDRFRLLLVVSSICNRAELLQQVPLAFAQQTGEDVRLAIEFVSDIERQSLGKHRMVRSEMPRAHRDMPRVSAGIHT